MLFRKYSSQEIEILKWIAIIGMVIDHIGLIVLADNEAWRTIGRISFPIFGFVLVHNFLFFTKDKKKYINRLWLFAVISQPIYMLTIKNELNVFFILALSLSSIWIIQSIAKEERKERDKYIAYIVIMLLGTLISSFMSYGIIGFLFLHSLFFAFHFKKNCILSLVFLILLNYGNIYYAAGGLITPLIVHFIDKINIEIPRSGKWFFYLFYPTHLIIIYASNIIL